MQTLVQEQIRRYLLNHEKSRWGFLAGITNAANYMSCAHVCATKDASKAHKEAAQAAEKGMKEIAGGMKEIAGGMKEIAGGMKEFAVSHKEAAEAATHGMKAAHKEAAESVTQGMQAVAGGMKEAAEAVKQGMLSLSIAIGICAAVYGVVTWLGNSCQAYS